MKKDLENPARISHLRANYNKFKALPYCSPENRFLDEKVKNSLRWDDSHIQFKSLREARKKYDNVGLAMEKNKIINNMLELNIFKQLLNDSMK